MTGFDIAISTNETTATGMLIQKIALQVHSVRYPPATGPTAVRPPAIPKKSAKALPRWWRSNVCTTIANAAGIMIAPPTPCTARNDTIHISARSPFGVRPHIADAPANTITPMTTILRCPTVSANLPPKANDAANARR